MISEALDTQLAAFLLSLHGMVCHSQVGRDPSVINAHTIHVPCINLVHGLHSATCMHKSVLIIINTKCKKALFDS